MTLVISNEQINDILELVGRTKDDLVVSVTFTTDEFAKIESVVLDAPHVIGAKAEDILGLAGAHDISKIVVTPTEVFVTRVVFAAGEGQGHTDTFEVERPRHAELDREGLSVSAINKTTE